MIRRTVSDKKKSFIVGKATNPLLKPCENSDIYAFMIKTTKKNAVVALRTAWWRQVGCRYSTGLSRSCFVASTVAGLLHYVGILTPNRFSSIAESSSTMGTSLAGPFSSRKSGCMFRIWLFDAVAVLNGDGCPPRPDMLIFLSS